MISLHVYKQASTGILRDEHCAQWDGQAGFPDSRKPVDFYHDRTCRGLGGDFFSSSFRPVNSVASGGGRNSIVPLVSMLEDIFRVFSAENPAVFSFLETGEDLSRAGAIPPWSERPEELFKNFLEPSPTSTATAMMIIIIVVMKQPH